MDETAAHPAREEHAPHVLPARTYLAVWGGLLALTAVTVAVSYRDFGAWNLVISLLVASTKAALVAAVFMHLAWGKRFNAVIFGISLVFLAIMLAFTFADAGARGMAEPIEGVRPQDWTAPFVNGKPATRQEPERAPAGK